MEGSSFPLAEILSPAPPAPAVKFILQGVFFKLGIDGQPISASFAQSEAQLYRLAPPTAASASTTCCSSLGICNPGRLAQSWGSRYLSVPHGRSADTLSSPRINEENEGITPSPSRSELKVGLCSEGPTSPLPRR